MLKKITTFLFLSVLIISIIACPVIYTERPEDIKPEKKSEDSKSKLTQPEKKIRASDKYYMDKIDEFKSDNPKHSSGKIVMLGDSITERFPLKEFFNDDLDIINRGIGGDKLESKKLYGIMDRLDVSVYDLKPSKIFIMIGINDIIFLQTSKKELLEKYSELINAIKKNCPKCKIYIQSVLPLRGKYSGFNNRVDEFNKDLRRFAENKKLNYINLYKHFIDEKKELKEEFSKDDIHLTASGYEKWAEIISPIIKK